MTWDDSTYQKYGAYYCLIDNGKQSKEHQVLGIAQMPLENKVNIQGRGPDDAITEEDEENIAQQFMLVDDIAALTAEADSGTQRSDMDSRGQLLCGIGVPLAG